MAKKLLLGMLAFAITFGLIVTGCGDDDDNGSPSAGLGENITLSGKVRTFDNVEGKIEYKDFNETIDKI